MDLGLLDFGTSRRALTFTLRNDGGEPFDFRILSSQPWLSASPFEGRVSGQPVAIAVTVDRAAAAGADDSAPRKVSAAPGGDPAKSDNDE